MAKDYFKSYIWLLETLNLYGRLTLKEIKSLWKESTLYDKERDNKLATRTFANHIASIADIFGIDIACDRRDNTYRIENKEDMCGNSLQAWMLNSLSLNSLLGDSASLRNRIYFEEVPSNKTFLSTFIRAIRNNSKVRVRYGSYNKDYEESFVIAPYLLRENKRRWYLWGDKGDADGLRLLSLDRILSAEITTETFSFPEEFLAKDYLYHIYGVRGYHNMSVENVCLKVTAQQAKYFESLPLHKSQKVVEKTDDYTLFSYYTTIDYDLKQDILSFGASVEVLEPKSLREEIKSIIYKTKTMYEKNGN